MLSAAARWRADPHRQLIIGGSHETVHTRIHRTRIRRRPSREQRHFAHRTALKVERPTSELITREQIDGVKSSNLLDVVEALHSNWLRQRMLTPGDRATTRQDTTGKPQYTAENNGVGTLHAG